MYWDGEGYGDCEVGEAEYLAEQEALEYDSINSCDALRIIDGVLTDPEREK